MESDMDKLIKQLTAATADAAEKWGGDCTSPVSDFVSWLREADSCAIKRLAEAFRPIIESLVNRPDRLKEIDKLLAVLDELRPDDAPFLHEHMEGEGWIRDGRDRVSSSFSSTLAPEAAIRALIVEAKAEKKKAEALALWKAEEKKKTIAQWKVEFYPVTASYIAVTGTDLDIIDHVILKWEGGRPENRDRYGLVLNGCRLVDKAGDRFVFDAMSCSLCHKAKSNCERCLIRKASGGSCNPSWQSPYAVFHATGDPKPMLELLHQTRAFVIAEAEAKPKPEPKRITVDGINYVEDAGGNETHELTR